jgi:CoA:oxalate CoA-transferase
MLNLKKDSHRDVLYKLVENSDAVLENFIPGVTKKLKIDYNTLKKVNK